MRCLVTGATGFVGRHLLAALSAAGHSVVGLARAGGADDSALPIPLYSFDLCATGLTADTIRETRPEWVFHLAGYADNGRSFEEPAAAWAGNLQATASLYAAIVQSNVRPRILFVSTGLVYGDGSSAFAEDAELRPASPYAASKAAADLLSYQQTRHPGLDIVRVRPFNQIGPGQAPSYALARWAQQIAACERGAQSGPIVTKDLSGQRDLTDVRDMVQSYIRLLERGRTGAVYNAGSGRTFVMREVLQLLLTQARVSLAIEEHADASRTGDAAVSSANIAKIRTEIGWQPKYPLAQTLRDILDDWRQRDKQC